MDLELANPRTEVLTLGEGLESWARGIETLEWQVVTTPADFHTLLLQGEEYDQGGDRNGARESGGGDAGMEQLRHNLHERSNQILTSCTSTTKR